MKLNYIKIIILILCIYSNTIIPCCKRRQKSTKALTVQLQEPLSPLAEDLESGRGMQSPSSPTARYVFDEDIKAGTGAGKGVGLGAPAIRRRNGVMRARTRSDGSGVVDSLDNVHATLAGLLARQETRQKKRDDFEQKVYSDVKCSKRSAFVGTCVAITYTTIGFIWQNWPAISNKFFGHGDGPDAGPSNSTGT